MNPYQMLATALFVVWAASIAVAALFAVRRQRRQEMEAYTDCDCFDCAVEQTLENADRDG